MKKNILFVTGTRADYGKLKPLAKIAKKNSFKVSFYVTGMHVLERYGLTKLEVHRDGYDQVDEFINQNKNDTQSIIISKTIAAFSDFLLEKKPDLVIVHGDRPEALACAIAATSNYYKLLHVEGGEVSGTIDEVYRHAISKLASAHLVSSKNSKTRLINLGEDPSNIHNIGSPELMLHLETDINSLEEVKRHYGIKFSKYGIVAFHPVTSERETMLIQSQKLFGALNNSNKKFIVILPNNDPGSDEIMSTIDKLSVVNFHVIPSMRFEYFSVLLKNAGAIIGNSSAGVREAPFLGIPSLNYGTRQTNRAKSVSITNVNVDEIEKIQIFLDKNWYSRFEMSCEFGSGDYETEFSNILLSDEFWQPLEQKYFYEDKRCR